MTKAVNKQNKV